MADSLRPNPPVATGKKCCACGIDVSQSQRFKNKQGKYFCPSCVTKDITLSVDPNLLMRSGQVPAPKFLGLTLPSGKSSHGGSAAGNSPPDTKKLIGGALLVMVLLAVAVIMWR